MARALMVLAVVAPLGGCWIVQPCGSQGCPPAAPVSDGLYAIDDHGREDLVDGVVEIATDTVFVEYVDADGNTWEVEYAVTERTEGT